MIFKSPHAPVNIPDSTITEYVCRKRPPAWRQARADRWTKRPHLHLRTTSQSDWPSRCGGPRSSGRSEREVFAIYSPNLPEVALAFHAVAAWSGNDDGAAAVH